MDADRWTTWRPAMQEALYGPDGFYRAASTPGRHFRTGAHTSTTWTDAMCRLADDVDASLGRPSSFSVVDVGAGGGELLRGLAALAPWHWDLIGVDVAPRPDALPDRVTWTSTVPEGTVGLLIANELLDVVPLDVVERVDGWPRQVEVDLEGSEELGGLVTGRDAQWLSTWWPLVEDGDRAEIGWPRDDAWRSLCDRMGAGLAVAVDYAADPDRDLGGTLTGYRDGRQVSPTPDGSCDLTAHVLFDSLTAPGDLLLTQREALQLLGFGAQRPGYAGDPRTHLEDLAAAGTVAELIDPDGLGGFTWLLHPTG